MKVGDKVKILECHSIPELAGRQGKIVVEVDPEFSKYPFKVMLTDSTITLHTPLGDGETAGPFPFRADELELVGPTELPEIFKKALGEEKGDGK